MSKFVDEQTRIEVMVVSSYQKIEDTVVSGYQKIDDTVVFGYKKIENKFVDTFLSGGNEVDVSGKEHRKGTSAFPQNCGGKKHGI